MTTTTITVTIPNITPTQAATLAGLVKEWNGETSEVDTTPVKRTRGRPAKTVSDDEDEDFARSEISARDLSSDDAPESEDEDESDDQYSEDTLSFDTVKDAINRYGNKNPDAMHAILSSFNIKSTKELKAKPVKWEPVYRKVMSKLKK